MTVLWYVHDRGNGHLQRACAVIPLLASPVVVTVGPLAPTTALEQLGCPVVVLPSDVPADPPATIGPWHHAPASSEQLARSLAIADTVRRHGCTTAVVDVSMEVTVLARLLGMRVVTVRQSGRRSDEAHRIGFASADVVWVPQREALERVDSPVDDRWRFTGAFSRFDDTPRPPTRRWAGTRLAVLLVGTGGHGLDVDAWSDTSPPAGWRVVIAGTERCGGNREVAFVGRQDPVFDLLTEADVVVASAGWAAVADVVSAGSHLVVVPESRPYDEQSVRAEALAAAGLAVCRDHWPGPHELASALEEATQLDASRWDDHYDRRGAYRAADMIDEVHLS